MVEIRVVSKKDYGKIEQEIIGLNNKIEKIDKEISRISEKLDTLYSNRRQLKDKLSMLRTMKNLLGGE